MFSAVIFLALFAVALAAVRAVEVSHKAATETASADLLALEDAHELQNLLYQKGFVAEYFLTGEERWLDELRHFTPEFEKWLATITRDAHTDETARVAAQLVAEYGRYDADRERAVQVFQHGDRGAATQMLVENHERAVHLRELAAQLIKLRRDEVTARFAAGERVYHNSVLTLLVVVILAMLGAAAVGYTMAQKLGRPLDEMADRLTQAEKMSALGEMATAVAHEVLNPLTGVKTAMQLLGKSHKDPEISETVSAVDTEIRRVETIARRLVSFARPLQPNKQPCDLEELLERVRQSTRVEFRSDVEGVGTLEADPDLLMQVLVNLTVNAEQAGGGTRVRARRESGWTVVEVSDEGEGLKPEVASKLFTPFVTTKRDGHGLGLAISQNIALAHGGRIEAHPNSPRGTTFAVWLPEAA